MGIASGVRQYHFAVVHPFRLFLIPRFLVNFLKVVKTRAYNDNSTRNTQCINTDSEKRDVLSDKRTQLEL
jgi:hypothetical protein